VMGTRLKTKLVAALVSLSLVPTMLLFFTSVIFITHSVENWFSVQVENSLQGSLQVAQTYYRDFAKNCITYSQQIGKRISTAGPWIKNTELLEQKRTEYKLGAVRIFSPYGNVLARVTDSSLLYRLGDLPEDLVKEALTGKVVSKISPVLGGGEIVWGASPLREGDKVIAGVATGYYVPETLAAKMEEISQAFVDYKQAQILKKPLTTNYILILLLITLLIIFSAMWIGFRFARELTVPIEELAEGTRRVASGDLDFHLDSETKDEIGTLISAFNKMTADLKSGKIQLEKSNVALQLTNLELEQRRKYMEIVLANVGGGVISLDKDGRITTVNKSAERILDVRAEDVLGRNYRTVMQPEYRKIARELIREINRTRNESIEKQMEIHIRDKAITVLAIVNILRDEQGNYLGMVAVFDDLTDLIHMQRLAAWREVARRIAHEIKNPLTPIQLSAQRLYKKYRSDITGDAGIFEECTNTIIHQVNELKNLVNEFFSFARMPSVNPTPNDLNTIINESLVLYKEAHRNIHFNFLPDPELPIFKMDREQMKRAVINLLDNAVAAVDGGGVIEIEVRYKPTMQTVTLEVRDNGCGVPDEYKQKLFEPYFSTKKRGTGLGLAIVNTIVSEHSGYIRVRDNNPKGTRFIIDLPLRT